MKKYAAILTVTLTALVLSQSSQAQSPPALYDESKVPSYTLPDLLTKTDGKKVKSVKEWESARRREILQLFADNVYGQTMVEKPHGMTWEVIKEDRTARHDSMIVKTVAIYFTGKKDSRKMTLTISLPRTGQRVPVFFMPSRSHDAKKFLVRGYGLVTFSPREVEPDQKDSAYLAGIRKFLAPPEQTEPGLSEWGSLGAWAWAMSRAMDYLETDKDVDAKKVSIMGFSRYGKVAMWAGAQDQRFAIIFSGESGCGGAVIVRRGYGETVRSINGYAPHWFSKKFKEYNERVNDLPVDWHMLVALMAPRPVYIATAEGDRWGDPKGSFLAALYAQPVYDLYHKTGLGVTDMPALESPVGDWIGYHNRTGGHGVTDYDWDQFFRFADRHFGMSKK